MSALNLVENRLRSLWEHFTGNVIAKVPSCDAVCEFECRETRCSTARWRTCERRLAQIEQVPTDAVDSQAISSATEGANHSSTSQAIALEHLQVTLQELGSDYKIRNVLIFRPPAPPLKRTEIHLDRAECKQVATSILAATLHAQGFTLLNVKDGQVPANEIWLTVVAGHSPSTPLLRCHSSEAA